MKRSTVVVVGLALGVGLGCGGESRQQTGAPNATTGATSGGTAGMAATPSGGTAGLGTGASAGAAGRGTFESGGTAGSSSGGSGGTAGGITAASGGVSGAGAPQNGGAAGEAPEPVTDAEFCEEQCSVSAFNLPGAFCEDLQLPDPTLRYSFCDVETSGSCAERCGAQLSQTVPACHEALREAIPCAAKYVYASLEPPVPLECLFGRCIGEVGRVMAECLGVREELRAARDAWATIGATTYLFEYQAGSSEASLVAVVGGVPHVSSGPALSPVPTIPSLFDRIEQYLDGGTEAEVEFDTLGGYPRTASFFRPCVGDIDAFQVSNLVVPLP